MMQQGAESGYFAPSPTAAPRPLRALPVEEDESAAARDALILRLAADRLRDLRDDGLTLAYAARMYGIDSAEMEALEADLLPWRQR